MNAPPRRSFPRTAGLMLGGLLIWTGHFLFIYGFAGLVCARPSWGWADDGFGVLGMAIVAATAAAALGIAAVIGVAGRSADRFTRRLAIAVALLALVAIVWQGLTVLLTPGCR
jgi:hypothetical protein